MSEETTEYVATPPVATNGHAPVTRLCALDKLFVATGIVEVKAGLRTITLPIQAVDNEFVESLAGVRPNPPVRVELRQGQRVTIRDEANAEYQQRLEAYQRDYGYVYTLCALAVDLVDSDERIVWSSDNSVHDLAAAKQVLRRMGLVDNQRATILNAALNLTRTVEDAQVSE